MRKSLTSIVASISLEVSWLNLLFLFQKFLIINLGKTLDQWLCVMLYKNIVYMSIWALSGEIEHSYVSEQNGFIHGRVVSENYLVVQDVVHSIYCRNLKHNVIIKVYMENILGWKIIWNTMERMNFSSRLIEMVANIVLNSWFPMISNRKITCLSFFYC